MSAQSLEVSEKSSKPLILLYSNTPSIQHAFLKSFHKKCSLLFLSDSVPDGAEKADIYHIKPADAHLIPHLEEQIDYAVILLEAQDDKKSLDPLITKLSHDRTKTLLGIPAEKYKDYVDVILAAKEHSHIIPAFVGEVLDGSSRSHFLKFIQNGILNQSVRLAGDELTPVFPISIRDLLFSINYLLFSREQSTSLFFLFYKKPQTYHDAMHSLAQVYPDIELHIDHEKTLVRHESREDMLKFIRDKLQLTPYYLDTHMKGFTHAVKNINTHTIPLPTAIPHKKPAHARHVPKLPKLRLPTLSFSPSASLALVTSLALFLVINIAAGIGGMYYLRESIQAYERSDFLTARERGTMAKNLLALPQPTLAIAESTLSHIPLLKDAYQTLRLVNTTSNLTTSSSDILNTVDMLKTGISKNDLQSVIANTHYLYHEGSRVLLTHENRALSHILNSSATKLLSVLPVAPTILGYDEEKEYLLLFLNNAELRPGGGFIGSVGRLIVKEGRVVDFSIQDVYEVDGQLTQHVEPHYIIRRNLQPHLYLRDSNFDLDFQKSASQAALLYNLSTKNKPDGIVAVDFSVMERLLKITGPIELRDYKTTVTAENSFDFLQKTIDDNFFPGSTQKKEVLEELMTQLILKFENNPEYLISASLLLPELLEEKHIQLAYQTENIQSLFTSLGFGGVIPNREEGDSNTIYDTVGVNEANIGVNKVNRYVSRSITYEADLTLRRAITTLDLRNQSTKDTYTAYIRVLAPQDSSFSQLYINGKMASTIPAVTDPRIYEARGFKPDPSTYEIETTNEYGKTVFGTVVTVPKNSTLKVQFIYSNPRLFLAAGKTAYDLMFVKQAGVEQYPLGVALTFPEEYAAEGEEIDSFGDGSARINTEITKDAIFTMQFKKE